MAYRWDKGNRRRVNINWYEMEHQADDVELAQTNRTQAPQLLQRRIWDHYRPLWLQGI